MVYAYDLWAQLPVRDLYDTLMMLASINAAKDMYEKGTQEIKEFKKEYGDFLSPILKDMDWYSENVTGKMRRTINDLYAAGIDPVRSAEGRAAISRMINDMDYGRIARNRESAKNADLYLKNRAALEAAGKYDPVFEELYLGYNIGDFDSGNGVWNRLSPVEAKSLKSLTESSFNNAAPHLLTKDEVESFGMAYDPKAQYKGLTYGDLLGIANTAVPGLKGTIYDNYYRYLAELKLKNAGIENPTSEQISAQLSKDIANSLIEYIRRPDPNYDLWTNTQRLNIARAKARGDSNRTDNVGWTTRQKINAFLNFTLNVGKNGGLLPKWNSLQTTPQGADKITALAFASGVSDPEAVAQGMSKKRLPVTFEGADISLTVQKINEYNNGSNPAFPGTITKDKDGRPILVINRMYSTNHPRYKRRDMAIVNDFSNWLKSNHIEGFIPSTSVTINYDSDINGNDVYDINSYIRVKKEDILPYFGGNGFISRAKSMITGGDYQKIGKIIGMVAVRKDGKRVVFDLKSTDGTDKWNKDLKWDEIEYLDIPFTRTITARGYDNSVLDVYHDVETLGKSITGKREGPYEDRDESDIDL